MLNKEKCAKDIMDIVISTKRGFAINKNENKICDCCDI